MPITAIILAAPLLAAPASSPASSAQLRGPGRRGEIIVNRPSASVVIDGQRLAGGVIVSGANRVLVEMRPIFERLGARVDWDANLLKVSAYTPKRGIELAINSNIAYLPDKTTLDSPPILRDNRVYIPLRAVSQAFDASVRWEPGTRTARITTDKAAPRNDPTGRDGGGAGLGGG